MPRPSHPPRKISKRRKLAKIIIKKLKVKKERKEIYRRVEQKDCRIRIFTDSSHS
jgi:hypothetical protein